MTKKNSKEQKSLADDSEDTAIPVIEEEVNELEEADASEEMELSDIPIEQFLKDPKMSEITEESEVEEITAWCPVCNEYTIFVDKTCTVCGFVKGGGKKSSDKDETEESTDSTFDLIPSDEVIDEMSGGATSYDEDENGEGY